MHLKQTFVPARATSPSISYRGDQATFRLTVSDVPVGRAFLRTNLGMGAARCGEAIRATEEGVPVAFRDWRDLTMYRKGEGEYELTLPLDEVGVFEAKAGWRCEADGRWLWPDGGNIALKIESAESVGANLIYTAFVRQFHFASASRHLPSVKPLDEAGYTVIPPSGTFRGLRRKLDFIFGELGSRILQLLPIHPTPTVYGRMGRFGSPFAALDYFAVDPALAEFDPTATPLEQFRELVEAVHLRQGRIFLDIPVNHTGWGSRLQLEHPDWFVRASDGKFESPGAWGVVWEDLCKLDYERTEVHALMAEVFLFWCRHGVDGFRCDAGYMLPESAWTYIVAKVRREFPDAIFLLEGLGGPIAKQERLLAHADLDWAYSELFQNYDYAAVRAQAGRIAESGERYGLLVNFAETHDNNRLAATSVAWSRMRLALCALLSENGAFGFANGVEWLATEKIDVHGNSDLRWDASDNLVRFIRQLQKLLAGHPAFFAGARVSWLTDHGPVVAVKRTAANGSEVVALVNLNATGESECDWSADAFAVNAETIDVFSDEKVSAHLRDGRMHWRLPPGGCAVLIHPAERVLYPVGTAEPALVVEQRTRLLAQSAWTHWRGFGGAELPTSEELAAEMRRDYRGFLRRAAQCDPPPVTVWQVPADQRRDAVTANGDLLVLDSASPFRAAVRDREGRILATGWSVPVAGDRHVWHTGLPENADRVERRLFVHVADYSAGDKVARLCGELVQLPPPEHQLVDLRLAGGADLDRHSYWFAATELGGMAQVRARWGELYSKYDAWLAANVRTDFPQDRRVMLARVRGWVVVDAYSQELNADCTLEVTATAQNLARWNFAVPVGAGRTVELSAELALARNCDAVRAIFRRIGSDRPGVLPSTSPVRLILRCDIDDRINHEVTKAFTGPEQHFPATVHNRQDGFDFMPAADRVLRVTAGSGGFTPEPEWRYMVDLDAERYYGLEASTDLFSPGYFEISLEEESPAVLEAKVNGDDVRPEYPEDGLRRQWGLSEIAQAALPHYVVRRNDLATVIAGYPWFLDWGRDTLIALRGLIRGGYTGAAHSIIRQFARFEQDGTIPNMIHGNDVSNRDTSDAPLWLFVATRDYLEATGDRSFPEVDVGDGRKLRDVLASIIAHYRAGTPNGIRMDEASRLIYSPPHFTWMDTNFPAASPREGYPIEIQALWFAANRLMAELDPAHYQAEADAIAAAIDRYFFRPELDRFADCLHAAAGTAAADAVADDAVRPNQLFALTLGAVTRRERALRIVTAAESLVVPGAIRTLADRPVKPPLPVRHDGRLLNDPERPYCGIYRGPEDTARKVAYHNGTAWCWPFPSYVEALYLVGGAPVRQRAQAILYSAAPLWRSGALGQLPEVLDGDCPHRWGGCGAQAWSVTEFYRVDHLLRHSR